MKDLTLLVRYDRKIAEVSEIKRYTQRRIVMNHIKGVHFTSCQHRNNALSFLFLAFVPRRLTVGICQKN